MWKWFGLLATEMVPVGFLIGSTLFGLNMLITCLFFRMNRNDAFSSLRIGAYNSFLRFRLTEHGFDMFVVGLESVPRRDDWVANPKHDKRKPNQRSRCLFRRLNSNRTSSKRLRSDFGQRSLPRPFRLAGC